MRPVRRKWLSCLSASHRMQFSAQQTSYCFDKTCRPCDSVHFGLSPVRQLIVVLLFFFAFLLVFPSPLWREQTLCIQVDECNKQDCAPAGGTVLATGPSGASTKSKYNKTATRHRTETAGRRS